MRMAVIVAGAALIAGTQAAAQDASDRVLRSFADCRAVADPGQRLACFDRAAAALASAVEKKDVRIVDRADVRKARRSLFGFALPNIDLFGGGKDDEAQAKDEDAFTEINTTVASASATGANGRVQIRLADDSGAVWQTTDPMNWPPKPGAKIRIRKGALGNYFIAVEGRSYRGQRVR